MKILAFRWLNWRRDFRIALILSVLAAMAWLCWKSARDPAIPLLRRAAPIGSSTRPRRTLRSIRNPRCRRTLCVQLELAAAPVRAEISWRAFRRSEISINGVALPMSGAPGGNWKNVSRAGAAPYFRPGTNTITATVWNSNGPPALSVRVEIDGAVVKSDENWSVSAGGLRVASGRVGLGGHEVRSGQRASGAGRNRAGPARMLAVAFFLVVDFSFSGGGFEVRFGRGRQPAPTVAGPGGGRNWVLLFAHKRAVASAEDRLRLVCASGLHQLHSRPQIAAPRPKRMGNVSRSALLCGCRLVCFGGHLRTSQWAGMMLLRCLSVVIGAANVALIYASLR